MPPTNPIDATPLTERLLRYLHWRSVVEEADEELTARRRELAHVAGSIAREVGSDTVICYRGNALVPYARVADGGVGYDLFPVLLLDDDRRPSVVPLPADAACDDDDATILDFPQLADPDQVLDPRD